MNTPPLPAACNPVLLNFYAHPILRDALVGFGKKHNLTISAGGRLVLHHFLTPGARDERVAAALAAPKQDLVPNPGLNRLRGLGISTTVEVGLALMSRAQITPNPAPTTTKPLSDSNDVARAILEAVFLSPTDRKLVVTRQPTKARRATTGGSNVSVYFNAATHNRLDTLLDGTLVSRSTYISLLVEDSLNGTNKAPRLLALPPSQQPARRTKALLDALG